jgi:TonB family protein
MLTAFVLALVLTPAADVALITPEQAVVHSGRDVIVQGRVTQVNESLDGKTLFLNFGERYPFHVFDAVIFERSLKSFPEARSWEGKSIKVRGKIQLYKGTGKPEIILKRPEQVTIESSPTRPQDATAPEAAAQDSAPEQLTVDSSPTLPQDAAAPEAAAQDSAGPVTDFDSPPRPIKLTNPTYPQEAFVNQIEGSVLVEILIDSQGRVVRARVIQSVPLLDAAALQCVYQWVFQPAVKHGRRVPTIAHVPLNFRIFGGTGPPPQRQQRLELGKPPD